MDDVQKRKLSCRAIAEEFKIGKAQATNIVNNEAKLREEFDKEKALNISKERNTKNSDLLMTVLVKKLWIIWYCKWAFT